MEINLNLLKFHSFYYDKRYNNLWSKTKIVELKEEIILDRFSNLLKHIKLINNLNQLNNLNCHPFSNEVKKKLFAIIETSHPNLFIDIFNLFSEDYKIEDFNIFQFRITSRSRCIFIIENNVLYPLIFDLKHCFYETKRIFDNNKNNENYEWDFKLDQETIKSKLKQA